MPRKIIPLILSMRPFGFQTVDLRNNCSAISVKSPTQHVPRGKEGKGRRWARKKNSACDVIEFLSIQFCRGARCGFPTPLGLSVSGIQPSSLPLGSATHNPPPALGNVDSDQGLLIFDSSGLCELTVCVLYGSNGASTMAEGNFGGISLVFFPVRKQIPTYLYGGSAVPNSAAVPPHWKVLLLPVTAV